MADQNLNLPPLPDLPAQPQQTTNVTSSITLDIQTEMHHQPTGKDYAIAGGIVLVAAILWFIVKNAYSNWLIGSQKKSPSQGSAASWALFGFLLFPTIGAALGFVDSTRFISLPYLVPLGLAAVVCLVLMLVISFKK